jgi:hypothetical protein
MRGGFGKCQNIKKKMSRLPGDGPKKGGKNIRKIKKYECGSTLLYAIIEYGRKTPGRENIA